MMDRNMPTCPWCGNEMELVSIKGTGENGGTRWRFACCCDDCGARGPKEDTKAAALESAKRGEKSE